MNQSEFRKKIQNAANTNAHKNYSLVRNAVWEMIAHWPEKERASRYWSEELAGLAYMFDASPLIIENLRHHCYHITGIRDYEYRAHHSHRSAKIERKYRALKEKDIYNVFVPESPQLGGFGYSIDGALVNIDTLKFYEVMIALGKSGIVDMLRNGKRHAVVEIGAGWGGFAYQFKTLFPNTTYIVVDLPHSILFGATYLKTLFPHAKTYVVNGSEESVASRAIDEYDFIFVPHYAWEKLEGTHIDAVINMVSFQEMTAAQVDMYMKKSSEWDVPFIYSMNRDCSPHNTELTSVSEIMSRYYTIQKIPVLNEQYTQFTSHTMSFFQRARKALYDMRKKKHSIHDYQHVVGRLKNYGKK